MISFSHPDGFLATSLSCDGRGCPIDGWEGEGEAGARGDWRLREKAERSSGLRLFLSFLRSTARLSINFTDGQ